ncbi:MAG: hypothetical protein OXC64_01785 [Flavobacteriaceae bacterium]|nr:hypothetical protein [Flavobacteriaceae bacterium]
MISLFDSFGFQTDRQRYDIQSLLHALTKARGSTRLKTLKPQRNLWVVGL